MSLNADYQKLEPGDEVRLFEVDGTAFGTGEVLRFHSYSLAQTEAEIATSEVFRIEIFAQRVMNRHLSLQHIVIGQAQRCDGAVEVSYR